MQRKLMWGALAAVMIVGMMLPAEAGHRHRRACSSCSGSSAGAWYHFTSGGGSYIPFAGQPVATVGGVGLAASNCAAPASYHRTAGHSYRHGNIHPAGHRVPSGCRNCGW